MNNLITLNHGSGGRQAHELITRLFTEKFGIPMPLTDSAVFACSGHAIAFTTDSYVVDPLFFPGGNIGKLAVCGTVNDLAVSGAEPAFISAAFIIEEGFPVNDLERIVDSMAQEAAGAGVRIVTGDTKVVGKGKCDKIFITTSGTGFLRKEYAGIGTGSGVRAGDKVILNGPLGNHAIAVLGSRNELGFTASVESDCVCLNGMIKEVLDSGAEVRFMRDLTRGGLSSVLHELAGMTGYGLSIDEEAIPVDEPVVGLCEIMGFDPMFLANEGKMIFVADEKNSYKILSILRSHISGKNSALIGEITDTGKKHITLNTCGGGRRLVDLPSGIQLPRIC